MMEVLPQHTGESATKAERKSRIVSLLINGKLTVISGDWSWDFFSENVFCSSAMLHIEPGNNFPGSDALKCLLHPDDLTTVQLALEQIISRESVYLQFRVITTYGEIKKLSAEGLFKIEVEDSSALETLLEKEVTIRSIQKDFVAKNENTGLQLATYERVEQLVELGTWNYNTATTDIFFSNGVFRIFGISPQSINTHLHTFNSFIHPEDRDLVLEYIDKAFTQQLPLQLDFRINRNNGEERLVSYSTCWMFSPKGEMILSGVIKDITAQRLQEARLKTAEANAAFQQRINYFSESTANIGNYQVNLYTRKTIFCDNLYSMYGLKPQSVPAGINMFSHQIHLEDRETVLAAHKKAYYDQENLDLEYRIMRKDGKLRYLREKSKMVVNDFNEMIMIGIVQDITVQKTLKDKVQEIRNRLLFRQLTQTYGEDAGRQGTWLWNLGDDEMVWSDNIYRLFGLKPGTAGLTQKYFFKLIQAEDRSRFEAELNNVLKDGKEKKSDIRIVLNGQIRCIRADLKIRTINEKEFFVAVLQDTTAEVELRQQLTERMDYAELLGNSVTDRIIVSDQSYIISNCNTSFLTAVGLSKDDVVGQNVFDIMPVSKITEFNQLYQRALRGETIYLPDVQGFLAKGAFDLSLVPVKNGNEVTGVLQIIKEVTREYNLQQQHTHRLQLIEKLLDATADRIVALDRNMNYTFWNQQAEAYYSIKQKEVIGKNILEIFPSFINDPSYNDFRKVLKGETIHISVNDSNSTGLFQETYIIPLKDEKDGVTGILWIVHDSTKDFLLKNQEQKTATITPDISEPFFRLNKRREFTGINKKAAEFFKEDIYQLSGKNIWVVLPQIKDSPVYFAIEAALNENIIVRQEFINPVTGTSVFSSITPSEDGVSVILIDLNEGKQLSQ